MSGYTVVDVVPDTPEWEQERRASVGASEAGAVIGESHFGNTPLSVYLDKIGASRSTFPRRKSIVTHKAEVVIEAVWRDEHADKGQMLPGFMARRPDAPWLHATFDRVIRRADGSLIPLQFKTAHPFSRGDWENGPLPDYLAQEDVECFILGAPFAYLYVWFYGDDFELYKLHARADRQAVLVVRARELMERVEARTPPAPTLGDDMAALYPAVTGKVVTADHEAVEAVLLRKETAAMRIAAVKEFKAVEADAEFVIEKFMGDATELVDPYNTTLIHSWRPDKNGLRRHYSPKESK